MSQATPPPASPYKGLIPYSEEDAEFFFGREELRDEILASMQVFRLTLLYGASGVGKSSVLRAGMVHRLRQLAAERAAAGERPEFCVVTFRRWRDDPVTGLRNAVQRAVTQLFPDRKFHPADTLSATLERWADEIECDLFIVLDQFEEYFLYHPQEEAGGNFVREFSRAVNNRDLRASFLISIREDALAKLDRFRPSLPNIFAHAKRVLPLSPEEGRKAIEMPLARYNELNAAGRPVIIEPELTAAILRDVQTGASHEAGWQNALGGATQKTPESQVEAPYLQQVMTRLWEADAPSGALRLETYKRFGGGKEIVKSHLSRTVEHLEEPEQRIAARIFRHLVTPSGTKIAQTAEDLAKYSELPLEAVTAVLGELSGAEIRILRAVAPPPDLPGAVRYEIFHDVLAAPINAWRAKYEEREREEERLRQEEERLRQERETIAAETFKRQQKEEAQRYRRKLVWASGIAVALLGLSIFAFTQRTLAINRKLEAYQARDEARRERASAVAANEETARALNEAKENLEAAKVAQANAQRQQEIAVSERKAAEVAKADALKQRALAVAAAREKEEANRVLRANEAILNKEIEKRKEAEREAIAQQVIAVQNERRAQDKAKEAESERLKAVEASNKAVEESEKAVKALADAEAQRDRARRAIGLVERADEQTPFLRGAMRGYGSMRNEEASGRAKTKSYPRNAAFSPDAKYVVTAGNDGSVRVWETDKPYEEPVKLEGVVPGDAAPQNDREPVKSQGVSRANSTPQYNITAAIGQKSSKETGGKDTLVAATLYQGGQRGSAVGIWKMAPDEKGVMKGNLVHTLKGHTGLVTALAFYSDGNFLVSGSTDGAARIWNLGACGTGPDESCESTLLTPKRADGKPLQPIVSVAISRDNRQVATGDTDGVTNLWACDGEGRCAPQRPLPKRSTFAITSIDFSADGKRLVTASEDGTARIWKLEDRGKEATLHDRWEITIKNKPFPFPLHFRWRGRKRPVMTGAAFLSREGDARSSFVVTSSADGRVQVWDLDTETVAFELRGHLGRVTSAAYNPQGKLVITAGEDDTVRIWDPCAEQWDNTKTGTKTALKNFTNYCKGGEAASGPSR